MPELIIPDSFSLLEHQQRVIAGALAGDSRAHGSARQEESWWLVHSQPVIRQGGEPRGGPDKHNANKEESQQATAAPESYLWKSDKIGSLMF